MKKLILSIGLLLIGWQAMAQNAGIGTATPVEKLDVNGAVKLGTTTGTNAGTIKYEAGGSFYGYSNGLWNPFITSVISSAWGLSGNAGTSATTNFLGTTDAVDFLFRTNNTERMRILSGGNVGIGTNAPAFKFAVSGGPLAQADWADGDKFLLLGSAAGSTNATKMAHIGGFGMGLYAGSVTGSPFPAGANVGYFTWYTNDGTGAAWQERMRLNATGLGIGNNNPNMALALTAGANQPADGYGMTQQLLTSYRDNANAQQWYSSINGGDRLTFRRGNWNMITFSPGAGGNNVRLGINTPTPAATLHVFAHDANPNDAATILVQANSGAGQAAFISAIGTSQNAFALGNAGVQAPTFTNRSAGTKFLLWNELSATNSDFALGIENNYLWNSVPRNTAGFKWYAGTTEIGRLSGNGTFQLFGGNIIVGSNGASTTAGSIRYAANKFMAHDGTAEKEIALVGGLSSWSPLGNTGTTAGTNFIGTTDAQDFVIKTANAERVRVSSAGNYFVFAGSGVNLPSTATRSTGTKLVLWEGTVGTTADYAIGIANSNLWNSIPNNSQIFSWYAGASEIMRLTGGGNLGIGTAAPAQKLDVQGGNARINSAFIGDNGFGTNWATFAHNGMANTTGYALTSENTGNYTFINKKATGTGYIGFRIDNVDKVAISEAGNIGIGTTTPNGSIQFANADVPRRIVLWENGNNDHQFTGLGLRPQLFNFQVNNAADNFAWQVGTSTTTSNEVMRLTGAGNLGIGTTAPSTKLHIVSGATNAFRLVDTSQGAGKVLTSDANGNATWSAVTGTAWGLTGNAGTNPTTQFIGTTDNVDFVARTNNTERMRISAAGNVGIGTNAPNAPLQFSDALVSRKIVMWDGGSNNDHQYHGFGVNAAASRYQLPNTGSSHIFYAAASATASNELMRITGTGNVGIGTSAPAQKLSVVGTSSLASFQNTLNNGYTDVIFKDDAGANQLVMGFANTGSGGTLAGHSYVQTANNDFTIRTNSLERMRAAGNVGIGTINPQSRIDLEGGNIELSDNALYFRDNNNTANGIRYNGTIDGPNIWGNAGGYLSYGNFGANQALTWNSSGNVGVGTAAPSTKLHIVSGATNAFRLVDTSQGAGKVLTSDANGNATWASTSGTAWGLAGNDITAAPTNFIGTTSNHDLILRTNNTEKARITAAGNVGIGNSAPTARLQFGNEDNNRMLVLHENVANDNAQFWGLGINYGGGGSMRYQMGLSTGSHIWYAATGAANTSLELMRLTGAGNLGIGTNAPTAKMHINTSTTNGFLKLQNPTGNRVDLSFVGNTTIWTLGQDPTVNGSNDFFLWNDQNGSAITVKANNNVGIGTNNPLFKLSVSGGPVAQADWGDGDKFLLMGSVANASNAAKITHNGGWGMGFYAGSWGAGLPGNAGANGGHFAWHTVNGTNDNWQERMRLNATGLGIGNNNPNVPLSVTGSAPGGNDAYGLTEQYIASYRDNANAQQWISEIHGGNRLTYRRGTYSLVTFSPGLGGNNARVGINTPTPAATLHVFAHDANPNDAATLLVEANSGVGQGAFITVRGTSQNAISFAPVGFAPPSTTTRSVGTKVVLWDGLTATATDYALGIDNQVLWSSVPNNACAFRWYAGTANIMSLGGNGSIASSTGASLTAGGVWTNASDRKLKTNIKDLRYGLNEVMKLRPVSYTVRADNRSDIGFIAQEVEEVLPELVYTNKDTDMKSMSYGQLTSVLVNAIQDLKAQIDALKAENGSLKGELNGVKTENKDLKASVESRLQALEMLIQEAKAKKE
jgi:Chaperone of endosialidase